MNLPPPACKTDIAAPPLDEERACFFLVAI
jgi:hypothetical protein